MTAALPPIPPAELLVKVIGRTGTVRGFLHHGAQAVDVISQALDRHGIALADQAAVLDWGCGVGRVLRHWPSIPGQQLYGTDYDGALVAWCQDNLDGVTVVENELDPPLPFPPATFDLVYGFSVFTHLTDYLFYAWVREINRVLKPAGYFLFSANGEHDMERMRAEEAEAYRVQGFVVRGGERMGSNACWAVHSRPWVEQALAELGFGLVEFVPEGARCNGRQDLYLARKT